MVAEATILNGSQLELFIRGLLGISGLLCLFSSGIQVASVTASMSEVIRVLGSLLYEEVTVGTSATRCQMATGVTVDCFLDAQEDAKKNNIRIKKCHETERSSYLSMVLLLWYVATGESRAQTCASFAKHKSIAWSQLFTPRDLPRANVALRITQLRGWKGGRHTCFFSLGREAVVWGPVTFRSRFTADQARSPDCNFPLFHFNLKF